VRFGAISGFDHIRSGAAALARAAAWNVQVARGQTVIGMREDRTAALQMSIDRRTFLKSASAAACVTLVPSQSACATEPQRRGRLNDWSDVRAQFRLDPGYIHLAGLLLSSHPVGVAEAIGRHRAGLDRNPAHYLNDNRQLQRETREAAADYLGVDWRDIALTDSTTMGIGLVYAGVTVRPGQELLTSDHDYYSTRRSLQFQAERTDADYRQFPLYDNAAAAQVTEDWLVDRVIREVRLQTRVLATTWVHSSTGLKMPIARIAQRLERLNAGRAEEDRVLLAVDGVHALGVEDIDLPALGCDFFMAGTHKWLFGPRGTGIVWGNPETQAAVRPTIPTFTHDRTWGGDMSPGGFKPFEHQWGVAEAFRLHQEVGKTRVRERIHTLAEQFKQGLAGMPHITLYTPLDPRLSAGIVCFSVNGMSPGQVVRRLEDRRIIASTTPYSPSYARVTPTIFNAPEEVDFTLETIRELG
jgi:isopenicillin-N epimerase